MIINYLKLAIRHISKNKGYVFINIMGLAVGIACFVLIGLFVLEEISYDSFHEQKDRIYRLILDGKIGEQELKVANTSPPMGEALVDEIPEIINAARLDSWNESPIMIDDKVFIEDHFMLADSTFFDIFSFPLIHGDPATALNRPRTIVLTRSAAQKYFGMDNPIGENLKVGTDSVYWEVSGVCEDAPENTHLEFNVIGSFVSSEKSERKIWLNNNLTTYILAEENIDPSVLEEKIHAVLVAHVGPELEQYIGASFEAFEQSGGRYRILTQKITDAHLESDIQQTFKPANEKKNIYTFTIIAFAILLLAGINYMNLATAQAANRAREVGVRKVVGSHKSALIWQFLVESLLLCILSLLVAILLIELLLPGYNNLMQISLKINYFQPWYTIPILVLIAILVGFLSGTYPAFYLSSFRPISILGGKFRSGAKSGRLRSALVVTQLSISILIMAVTMITFKQVNYMRNKDLGFDKENLMVIRRVHVLRSQINVFINRVKNIPGVINASHTTAIPGYPNNNNGYLINSGDGDSAPDLNDVQLMYTVWADHDYDKTMGFELVEGRFFSKDMSTDSMACIINESAVQYFNLNKPLEAFVDQPGDGEDESMSYPVIGVVKNFHFLSLHDEISPHVFLYDGDRMNWGSIVLRLNPDNINATIEKVRGVWEDLIGTEPMQYSFVEEEFDELYKEDRRTGNLSAVFSILAVFIASLGLFGLTAFTVAQRTKEIGVRKVQGATMIDIMLMLSREIGTLVLISTLIAVPIAYFVMKSWLQNFYFRVTQSPLDYIIIILVSLTISWLTIGYRAFKAARTNAADALRYE